MAFKEFTVGVGATLLSKFLSGKSWTLKNLDSGEEIVGQFPAESPTREVASTWAAVNALNRQHPILQFVRGEADTFSVPTRLYRRDLLDESPIKKLERIIKWTRIQEKLRRPPILEIIVGAGFNESGPLGEVNAAINDLTGAGAGFQATVVLNSVAGITYGVPNNLGGIRDVRFQMNFTRYKPFDINESVQTDTRYARARHGDYYESLAYEEYGNALLGVVIRHLPEHDQQLTLKSGSVVKLPAIEGVRTRKVQPSSLTFKTAFGRKDTPQRRLRLEYLDLRSKGRPSFLYNAAAPRTS
jgi:hypothetical protein